ncbi:MAG: nitrogen fixation protein NifH [Anaerolineae bacterium]|nr:nitrogen fixation protein NifH [Anaerolineae bacterium]
MPRSLEMSWQEYVYGNALNWLLELDRSNPAIRYFALRDLLDRPSGDPTVCEAQAAVMQNGPVPAILSAQHSDGYWLRPGSGYGKYRGTAWQIIFLGELGADPDDERVRHGCAYLLSHSIASNGGFSANQNPAPNGVIHCLNGNLIYALIQLGYLADARVQRALDWEAHTITGESVADYRQSGTSGPDFACAANAKQPCGWGATKAMKALIAVPSEQRTPIVQRAIEQGAKFLLSCDLAKADYPYTGKISSAWFKLGFPLSYWSDILETFTVLARLGYGSDPRLATVYDWLMSKQDSHGSWILENSLNTKMWIDIEKKGKPSKWVTLRVLRAIKAAQDSVRAA